MAEEFYLPLRQEDFRCPCGEIHLRKDCRPWAQYACRCGGAKFTFNGPPVEARADRLAEALGGRVTPPRR